MAIQLQPTLYKIAPSSKTNHPNLAIFDLDSTLVVPKSGKKFPASASDWQYKYDNVKSNLQKLAKTHTIYIVTNQAGISTKKETIESVSKRITTIIQDLNIPVTAFIPTAKDIWRKPNTTIIEKYIPLTTVKSILYVGDAAGRPSDFSDTDHKFAYNIQLLVKFDKLPIQVKYQTETVHFVHPTAADKHLTLHGFNPTKFLKQLDKKESTILTKLKQHLSPPFIIILVGPAASGKSTLSKSIDNATIINQDTLGSKQACVKHLKAAILESKSVIIDRTNPSNADRSFWFDMVPESYHKVVIHMTVPLNLAIHLNCVRERSGQGRAGLARPVPQIAYKTYMKAFESPTATDVELVEMPFIPQFETRRHLLYFLQLCE